MLNSGDFLKMIKQASLDAVDNSKPVFIEFGTVTTVSPTSIMLEQKLTLTETQIVLCNGVKDYKVMVDMEWESGDTACQGVEHCHKIAGRKEMCIYNGLVVGEKVVLVRLQGGQKYLVVDRV